MEDTENTTKKLKALLDFCRAPFLAAMEEFNKKAGINFIPERTDLSFHENGITVDLVVKLIYRSGLPFQEKTTREDLSALSNAFRPYICKEMAKIRRGWVFGKILVVKA